MGWRVLATARHFNVTDEPARFLLENGCELVETQYGSSLNDGEITEDEMIGLIQDVDAIIIAGPKITRRVIEASPRLKVVSRRGVGFDSVDIAAATEYKVVVTIAPGTVDHGVADHVFALMLSAAKRVAEGNQLIKSGVWQTNVGREIWNKTLGIVGMGRIGKAVARRAKGFEMNVLAYDTIEDADFAQQYNVTYVSLEELMRNSDYVSINAPLNQDTYHLIDSTYLNMMKPSSIILNTARGGLIDEDALIDALKNGVIAGAGLDVFEHEPLGDSALRGMDNVVLTPHSGGYTLESMSRANLVAAQNVVSLMKGELPQKNAVVNPKAWEGK